MERRELKRDKEVGGGARQCLKMDGEREAHGPRILHPSAGDRETTAR